MVNAALSAATQLGGMRRLAALVLIALAMPTAAPAKEEGVPEKPRPMQVIQPVQRPTPPALELPAPAPPPSPPVRADAGQCTLACAQSYYFCLAGEDPGLCGPDWGQCRAGCGPSARPSWRSRQER